MHVDNGADNNTLAHLEHHLENIVRYFLAHIYRKLSISTSTMSHTGGSEHAAYKCVQHLWSSRNMDNCRLQPLTLCVAAGTNPDNILRSFDLFTLLFYADLLGGRLNRMQSLALQLICIVFLTLLSQPPALSWLRAASERLYKIGFHLTPGKCHPFTHGHGT